MGKTKDLGHLASMALYDVSGNMTLPAGLKINGSADVATQSYVGTQLGSYIPSTRSITINGTTYDLSADRSWTITSMIYPAAGIALSTGSAWGTSITNNSTNWNTAYGWGNHASAGYLTGITSAQVTTALGYTPYNSTNPNGYITGITSANVTTALGYTPYNSTNPSGYLTQTTADSRYIYGTSNPSTAGNFTLSIGNNGSYSYVQSHAGQPLELNPVGNTVRIAGNIVLHAGNYNSYAPTLTGGNASGTWGINITGTAGSAPASGGTATALNSSNYINRCGSSGNLNTDFQNTPAGTVRHQGDDAGLANSPGGSWWFYNNYRHSNSGNYWGTQVAWGWEDNAHRLATRNISANSFSGWVYYLNSNNYTSYIDAPNKAGTSYYQVNTWMQLNGVYGLYCPSVNGAHFYPNDATYGTWRMAGSRNSYSGIYDSYSGVNGIMYDSGGNGGSYRTDSGKWYFYYHLGNNCMGIADSATSSSYRLYVSGAIYATSDITAYSDRRKKADIVTIDNALDKVTQLRGVYYTKIDEVEKGRQTGVIAQETETVFPEVVTYAEDIDQYGVAYGNFAGLFIEAFKEHDVKINEQQKTIGLLLSQIEYLKQVINGIAK